MARCDWSYSIPKQQKRKRIHERDYFTCRMCGLKPSIIPKNYTGKSAVMLVKGWLEIDHIIPFSLGGTTDEENLQTLCNRCNCKKGVS